jgi:hypothetical protein
MTSEKSEHSGVLSKRDEKSIISTAINLFLDSELRVPEKSLNRVFEAIPGYQQLS